MIEHWRRKDQGGDGYKQKEGKYRKREELGWEYSGAGSACVPGEREEMLLESGAASLVKHWKLRLCPDGCSVLKMETFGKESRGCPVLSRWRRIDFW